MKATIQQRPPTSQPTSSTTAQLAADLPVHLADEPKHCRLAHTQATTWKARERMRMMKLHTGSKNTNKISQEDTHNTKRQSNREEAERRKAGESARKHHTS
eukprot:7287182-Alexandrium_andersonii.AAC.1